MFSKYLIPAAAFLGLAIAQTSTDCNPRNSSNCEPNPAFGTDHLFQFNSTPSGDLWDATAGTVSYDAEKGATFTIAKQGDSPTIRTQFYFFFGRTEVWLKAAPGIGIVSSMMWLSDDLDEVDWELLGANNTHAASNYFGKGRQDFLNGGMHYMKNGMQADYHNYTTVWTKDQIDWFIDEEHVRTLLPAEANSTNNYPQTPMRLSLGIWAGGDPTLPEGTRQWAGGDTNYDDGPYNMYVKKVQVTDFSSGKEYVYGDQTGDWKSIKITEGNSTSVEAINKKPETTSSEKWKEVPQATKTAVYAGGVGAGAIGLGALAFFFIRQRRRGAGEAKAAEGTQSEMLISNKGGESTTQQGHEYSSGWTRL
ncbi:hypothetical protein G7046_g1790 [Stylonectria norvegica]|nr:hypothetical protein G7046_g1790 [Stylonectria norvegica]